MRNSRSNSYAKYLLLLIPLVLLATAAAGLAQTPTFTYQGRLTDGGTPANGIYDMQFKLFDTPTVGTGTQINSTITKGTVTVTSGVFTVRLDYGAAAFPGGDRFLEISVRPASSADPYTTLSPRQQITSEPYALRTAFAGSADIATNAQQLGGNPASVYVQTTDSRLTDARAPTAGSSNYIQNSTATQAGSNFNISGDGTAGGTLSGNIVDAATQYSIGGNRVLSVQGTANTFLGLGAGFNNTASGNAFFGSQAGLANTTGNGNAFFGANAGHNNTASGNAFFGSAAGQANTTGNSNAFFGTSAGVSNTGGLNTFFGNSAGFNNTLGSGNTFVGGSAGQSNTGESNNTFIGHAANGAAAITNATAIGANASVIQSNSLVLGNSVNVGIGTTAPNAKLQVTSGDVYVQTQGKGIILRATDGTNCYRVLVNNTGTLATTLVTCP
jgi:hypothetical protein